MRIRDLGICMVGEGKRVEVGEGNNRHPKEGEKHGGCTSLSETSNESSVSVEGKNHHSHSYNATVLEEIKDKSGCPIGEHSSSTNKLNAQSHF